MLLRPEPTLKRLPQIAALLTSILFLSSVRGQTPEPSPEAAKKEEANSPSSQTKRPNILFILADDLGYGDVGVLFQNKKEGKKFKTPFFDQLASDGLILDRHYCPAPVCAPSRGSLLTGLHQGHANVRNNQFDKALEDNHNLATVLKAAGYSTHLIGKWGLQGKGGSPTAWEAYPTKRGFDTFFGYVRHKDGHTHYPGNNVVYQGKKLSPKVELFDQDENLQVPTSDEKDAPSNLNLAFSPDLFTAQAKKVIADEVNDGDGKPFFLFLSYDTPHAALQLPPTAYPGENPDNDLDTSGLGLKGGVQLTGTPGAFINTATGKLDSYRHPDYKGKGWADAEVRFATSVRRMDDNLGDLRQTLLDLGIADNTLIIFTSDNGPHNESYYPKMNYTPQSFQSYGPFEGQKRDCWEGGIREPAIICWPSTIPAGTTTSQHSQFHDWLPTLCEVAGITPPARIDGVSLLPTLVEPSKPVNQKEPTTYIEYTAKGKTPKWGDFSNHGGTTRSEAQVIFMDGYKGIRNDPADAEADFEIYDTIKDPDEAKNLAGTSPAFTKLQTRMKDRVLRIRRPDQSAKRSYDQAPVPALTQLPELVNGVRYKGYLGAWPWVPEFTDLRMKSEGVLDSGPQIETIFKDDKEAGSGFLFTGYLKVPTTGTWNFQLKSDSGSFLRIHEIMVVDDDYHHSDKKFRKPQRGDIRQPRASEAPP